MEGASDAVDVTKTVEVTIVKVSEPFQEFLRN